MYTGYARYRVEGKIGKLSVSSAVQMRPRRQHRLTPTRVSTHSLSLFALDTRGARPLASLHCTAQASTPCRFAAPYSYVTLSQRYTFHTIIQPSLCPYRHNQGILSLLFFFCFVLCTQSSQTRELFVYVGALSGIHLCVHLTVSTSVLRATQLFHRRVC